MSYVTNVVLTVDYDRDGNVKQINEWLETARRDGRSWGQLRRVDEHAGGTKAMEIDVWAGAFNHLDETGFIDFVRGLKWRWPAVLTVQTEDGPFETFLLSERVHEGADGEAGTDHSGLA